MVLVMCSAGRYQGSVHKSGDQVLQNEDWR